MRAMDVLIFRNIGFKVLMGKTSLKSIFVVCELNLAYLLERQTYTSLFIYLSQQNNIQK